MPSPFAFTDDFVNGAAYAFDSASIRRGKPLVHLRNQRAPELVLSSRLKETAVGINRRPTTSTLFDHAKCFPFSVPFGHHSFIAQRICPP